VRLYARLPSKPFTSTGCLPLDDTSFCQLHLLLLLLLLLAIKRGKSASPHDSLLTPNNPQAAGFIPVPLRLCLKSHRDYTQVILLHLLNIK